MIRTNMERRVICTYCRQKVYVPPSAQHIRCLGCTLVFSIDDSNNVVHHSRMPPRTTDTNVVPYKGMPPSAQHINCFGWEIDYSDGNTNVQNYRGTEDRGRRKKFPFSNVLQSQIWMPPNAISMTNQPRRGRRALLCGVSYKKLKHELKGVAQDVNNIKELLLDHYHFPPESILVLAEEGPYDLLPTTKNIEDAFRWLVRAIQPGDSLLFYFSGHGMRQPDYNGDEIDETICPMDFEKNGMILKSYINEAIVRPLIIGVTLHAIIDSSYSGTILDLPCVYDITTGKWKDNNPPPSRAYKGTIGGKAICFSACADYQLAAHTSVFSSGKEINGAMAITFINAIRASLLRNARITYQGIMDSMHQSIKDASKPGGFFAGIRGISHQRSLQDPQLSSSEEFNTSTEFKL